ncbi:aspartate aminotransferase family protein [Flavobacterium sp.]|uniref:pyridoxal phosphate-dependent decarboxylase family protein n=1 Tax=Flavobacterium sp. TaxID=239 RepID=UPI0035B2D8BB
MQYWKKLTPAQRQQRIDEVLQQNVNFATDASLGYPASRLDSKVFYEEAPFLRDAPTIRTYVANPNNIGCHTLGTSEGAFSGTQEIEREVLNVLAVDVFKSMPNDYDGYIAPGGTEANIQAIWVFRNYFFNKFQAKLNQIAILATEDTHYSIAKASNLLQIEWISIPVDFNTRAIDKAQLEKVVVEAKNRGVRYFIAVSNMGTTMFGSVDNPEDYITVLEKHELTYRLHVDGAYGGFVYPFSNQVSTINFENPKISSITIDAHKMLQAPYGTGVFICRKGLIENVLTQEAAYVEGMDVTLCGSRSGANAVAVWMILFTYGPYAWYEKISILMMRTQFLRKELDALGIEYYSCPYMNIVTIKASFISDELAYKYTLVPQEHNENNKWYKIVLMDHVEVEHLTNFIDELKASKHE